MSAFVLSNLRQLLTVSCPVWPCEEYAKAIIFAIVGAIIGYLFGRRARETR
jgi:hypothetical protein